MVKPFLLTDTFKKVIINELDFKLTTCSRTQTLIGKYTDEQYATNAKRLRSFDAVTTEEYLKIKYRRISKEKICHH